MSCLSAFRRTNRSFCLLRVRLKSNAILPTKGGFWWSVGTNKKLYISCIHQSRLLTHDHELPDMQSTYRRDFHKKILGKYRASYLQCRQCGFVSATPSEQWLEEAYSSAITSSDLGLLARNYHFAEQT